MAEGRGFAVTSSVGVRLPGWGGVGRLPPPPDELQVSSEMVRWAVALFGQFLINSLSARPTFGVLVLMKLSASTTLQGPFRFTALTSGSLASVRRSPLTPMIPDEVVLTPGSGHFLDPGVFTSSAFPMAFPLHEAELSLGALTLHNFTCLLGSSKRFASRSALCPLSRVSLVGQ